MRMDQKDYYAVLSVSPTASQEVIRQAYLSRARILHPDRFDREKQPMDWEQANHMLAELNQAYDVLGDAEKRRQYDQQKTSTPPRSSSTSTSSETKVVVLASGTANFDDLPQSVQTELLRRQNNDCTDQFKVGMYKADRDIILGLISILWFPLHLIIAKIFWPGPFLFIYTSPITLACAVMLAFIIAENSRMKRTRIKSNFIITPLYFIQTEFDTIRYWPIWSALDVSEIEHYKTSNSIKLYRSTSFVIKFNSKVVKFELRDKQRAERLNSMVSEHRRKAEEAKSQCDYTYFVANDIFANSTPGATVLKPFKLPLFDRLKVYALSLLLAVAIHNGITYLHTHQSTLSIWSGKTTNLAKVAKIINPITPEEFVGYVRQTVPATGKKLYVYEVDLKKSTYTVRGNSDIEACTLAWLGHYASQELKKLKPALGDYSNPKYVKALVTMAFDAECVYQYLGLTKGWQMLGVNSLKEFSKHITAKDAEMQRLGMAGVADTAHIYIREYKAKHKNDKPAVLLPASSAPPQTPKILTPPATGHIWVHSGTSRIAPFSIAAGSDENYFVKLVKVSTGRSVLDVFVRSGDTAEIRAPLGTYELRYASGKRWYGRKLLFGSSTVYSKADREFTFNVEGNVINGHRVTLYTVPNGNLSTQHIQPSEF